LNPAQYRKFPIKQIAILSIKPFAPFFTAFAAVAITAGWDKVSSYCCATFVSRPDVIQCVR